MKGFSLHGIVIAAARASPAFADDLCTTNLQKLENSSAALATLASPVKKQVEEHKKAAEEAQPWKPATLKQKRHCSSCKSLVERVAPRRIEAGPEKSLTAPIAKLVCHQATPPFIAFLRFGATPSRVKTQS
jgi:hypothetical protein